MELSSSSRMSDEPEAAGEEELSLSLGPSWFIATSTEAASRSWTCWCFDISNFDVYCHSGVCSHKCFVKHEPCLYALPQCSHLSSPEAALSFFDKWVPSLARRIFSFLSPA